MSSEKVFVTMGAGDWENVLEIIVATTWIPANLEKKHGVKISCYILSR